MCRIIYVAYTQTSSSPPHNCNHSSHTLTVFICATETSDHKKTLRSVHGVRETSALWLQFFWPVTHRQYFTDVYKPIGYNSIGLGLRHINVSQRRACMAAS